MFRTLVFGLAALALALPSIGACAVDGLDLTVSTELRHRSADLDAPSNGTDGTDDTDTDWLSRLGVEHSKLGVEGLSLSGVLWYGADVDGTAAGSPFTDLLDTYGGRDEVRVYRALLDYEVNEHLTVKAGRQNVTGAERATLDGALAAFESGCGHFEVELFAGRRVSFYSDPNEKTIYGGNVQLRPTPTTRLRLMDLYYIENSFEAEIFQKLGRFGLARVGYRQFGGEPLEVGGELETPLWGDAEMTLFYQRKLSDANETYGYDYTAFKNENAAALGFGSFASSSDYGVEFRQGLFNSLLYGYAKARFHNVLDEADEDEYNTDFTEVTAGAQLTLGTIRAAIEGSRWFEDRNRKELDEEDSWGANALVEYRSAADTRLGASYSREKYDAEGMERESDGLALWAGFDLIYGARLDLRYERANDDLYESEGVDTVCEYSARLNFEY
jgi:hypothetical protein